MLYYVVVYYYEDTNDTIETTRSDQTTGWLTQRRAGTLRPEKLKVQAFVSYIYIYIYHDISCIVYDIYI